MTKISQKNNNNKKNLLFHPMIGWFLNELRIKFLLKEFLDKEINYQIRPSADKQPGSCC